MNPPHGAEGRSNATDALDRPAGDDPFPHHYALLEHVHRVLRPRTYVEIGVDAGLGLRFAAPGTTVLGIDPVLRPEVVAAHPDAHLVEATSDEFFATRDLGTLLDGRPVDLAFVDGMHRFEHVLRDLANLQPYCDHGSVVLVHDCLPSDEACAARERATVAWAGDVWRAAHALVTEWPDAGFLTLDVPPTGMGLLVGLGGIPPLAECVAPWTARYGQVPFDRYEADPSTIVNVAAATPARLEALLPDPRP